MSLGPALVFSVRLYTSTKRLCPHLSPCAFVRVCVRICVPCVHRILARTRVRVCACVHGSRSLRLQKREFPSSNFPLSLFLSSLHAITSKDLYTIRLFDGAFSGSHSFSPSHSLSLSFSFSHSLPLSLTFPFSRSPAPSVSPSLILPLSHSLALFRTQTLSLPSPGAIIADSAGTR